MNDFSELEGELKRLRPAVPSADLMTRVEQALQQPPLADGPVRGAQAASLQFAAACRKHLRTLRAHVAHPFGKLPNGAGWQPALPRRVNWFALGLGTAAAAAFLILARVDVDRAREKKPTLAASTPAAPQIASQPARTLLPDGVTRVVYNTSDDGLVFPSGSAAPVRRVRSRSQETLQWKDPGTGASLRVSYPTEEIEFIPVSGQ